MKVFTFTEARQQFSSVLDLAQNEGGVSVTRKDGRTFIIQPVNVVALSSPLDVPGISLNISDEELVAFVQESRLML